MDIIKNPARSYHTFIFPFIISKNSNLKSIWYSVGWEKDEDPICYDAYHYFNPAARNAIFGNDNTFNQIVDRYKFKLSSLNKDKNSNHKTYYYVIETNENKYRLKIDAIRLRIYNTGIGMIVYELENHDHKTTLEDVNKINDYGRRLYMSYVNSTDQTDHKPTMYFCSACANNLLITSSEDENDFDGKNDKVVLTAQISGIENFVPENEQLPIIVTRFIPFSVDISPVIGDRMYVACICQNADLMEELSAWDNKSGNYAFLEKSNLRSLEEDNATTQLYRLIFVDGNGISCYNRNMMINLLSDHLYTRWIEYPVGNWSSGSVYGITEYSIVCLKGNFNDFTVPAFLCEYIRMAELVLAQRASLLMFEGLLSDCSLGLRNIRKVEEKYILFQSQLLLREISPEQQPIEVYNELLESSFIIQQSEQIEKQIQNLFELENYKATTRESRVLFLLAILGLAEVFGFIKDLISQKLPFWGYLTWGSIWVACGLLATTIFRHKQKQKKKNKKHRK